MSLSISELEEIQEGNKTSSIPGKVIDAFLAAINDWPSPILTLDDFESEVSAFVNGDVTKAKIDAASKKIDYSRNAWQAESLSQILDVFQFYKDGTSLKEIIEDLKVKLKQEV